MARYGIKKDTVTAYLFILPLVVIIVGLVAYTFIASVFMSFTNKFIGSDSWNFVGFQNYVTILGDSLFVKAFQNTLIWTFATVIFKITLGMCMALVLNQQFNGSGIVLVLLLVPWIMPTPISARVWQWIFDDMNGVLNYILMQAHLINQSIAWLGVGNLALASVIAVNLWRGTPFFGITLLAGMKNIPTEQYEAAKVDGANKIQSFWYITLPGLRFVLLITSLLESIWAMGDFTIVYIMTQGGPAGSTNLISTLTYNFGFQNGELGKAIAISLFPLPILALLIIGVTYLMDKGKDV